MEFKWADVTITWEHTTRDVMEEDGNAGEDGIYTGRTREATPRPKINNNNNNIIIIRTALQDDRKGGEANPCFFVRVRMGCKMGQSRQAYW